MEKKLVGKIYIVKNYRDSENKYIEIVEKILTLEKKKKKGSGRKQINNWKKY